MKQILVWGGVEKGSINYPQEFAKNGKYFNFLDEKYLC